ncbi:hypothetical protein [Phenylobacterium sp.]|jgi:hypothetical protein|uniref:hypothetical protein n=1 Tax=Phenylobacterium sp. TaxID=1871053 RepID=UPI002F41E8E0
MTSPIDSSRRSSAIRRANRTAPERQDEASEPETANLPIPVGAARTVPPAGPVAAAAAIEAQKLGERRGLRGGASVIDEAKATYNRTEWSGSRDRRAPKGRGAKTKV